MATLHHGAPPVKLPRPSLAECLAWTPRALPPARPGLETYAVEYRPEAVEPGPAEADRVYWDGFTLGSEGVICPAPEGLDAGLRASWGAGWRAGDAERWADYDQWLEEQAEFAAWVERINDLHESLTEPSDAELADRYNTTASFQGHDFE